MGDQNKYSNFDNSNGVSIPRLLKIIKNQISLLAQKEVELAKTEIQIDFKSRLSMSVFFLIAAILFFFALQTAFIGFIVILQIFMPLWAATFVFSVLLFICSIITGIIAVKKMVKSPLVRTRHVIQGSIKKIIESFK
jgi:uncharacterized membrane protein YqjE